MPLQSPYPLGLASAPPHFRNGLIGKKRYLDESRFVDWLCPRCVLTNVLTLINKISERIRTPPKDVVFGVGIPNASTSIKEISGWIEIH